MTLFTLFFAVAMESNVHPAILLVGPAGGVAFYTFVYLYYRNTNKSHNFEHETAVKVSNMRRHDRKVKELRGVRDASTDHANTHTHRVRVQPLR